jgi:hypothetical protein
MVIEKVHRFFEVDENLIIIAENKLWVIWKTIVQKMNKIGYPEDD